MKYLIIYNNLQGHWNDEELHKTIVGIKEIGNWWHYLPNTYIVDTTSSSKNLADKISRRFPGLLFLIIKVDLKDVNGVLVKSAWEWLAKQSKPKVKFKLKAKPKPKLSLSLVSTSTTTSKSLTELLGLSNLPKTPPKDVGKTLRDLLDLK